MDSTPKPDLAGGDASLFAAIADDLTRQGYSIRPEALPGDLAHSLWQQQQDLDRQQYVAAGIGRGGEHRRSEAVRSDAICWITGDTTAGESWLQWAGALQGFLNRRLFLGLFSFESHFAHYRPGDCYKRHHDAFRGETNRTLSIVVYLNPDWPADAGGELVLYRDDADTTGIRVPPQMGTIVAFLSEEFPHEVLPATCDRYSIAGWFRVNTTASTRIDPPQ